MASQSSDPPAPTGKRENDSPAAEEPPSQRPRQEVTSEDKSSHAVDDLVQRVKDIEENFDGEAQPFHKMSDDPDERLKEIVAFWESGEMDYPVELNPTLQRDFDTLTGNRKNLKVLVTLCGKSEELKWLSDKGHYVVGVDIAEKAARGFFEEHNLDYTEEAVPSIEGKVFTSKTGQIKYYCGNFFLFSPELEGQFDAVFDAAGFVSLDERDWDSFLVVFRKLLSPDCVFVLEVMEYDRKKFKGPPYAMNLDEIKDVFGNEFPKIELIEKRPNDFGDGFPFSVYCLRKK